MATHETTRQRDAAYRAALPLLRQAMDLLDGIDDSLTAAQLSLVIDVIDAQVSAEGHS